MGLSLCFGARRCLLQEMAESDPAARRGISYSQNWFQQLPWHFHGISVKAHRGFLQKRFASALRRRHNESKWPFSSIFVGVQIVERSVWYFFFIWILQWNQVRKELCRSASQLCCNSSPAFEKLGARGLQRIHQGDLIEKRVFLAFLVSLDS